MFVLTHLYQGSPGMYLSFIKFFKDCRKHFVLTEAVCKQFLFEKEIGLLFNNYFRTFKIGMTYCVFEMLSKSNSCRYTRYNNL